ASYAVVGPGGRGVPLEQLSVVPAIRNEHRLVRTAVEEVERDRGNICDQLVTASQQGKHVAFQQHPMTRLFVSGLRGLDQLDDAGVSFPHTLVRAVRDAGVGLVDQADVRLREYGRHDLRTVNIDGSVVVRLVLALPGGGV